MPSAGWALPGPWPCPLPGSLLPRPDSGTRAPRRCRRTRRSTAPGARGAPSRYLVLGLLKGAKGAPSPSRMGCLCPQADMRQQSAQLGTHQHPSGPVRRWMELANTRGPCLELELRGLPLQDSNNVHVKQKGNDQV